jgi:hypothetical protein
MTPDQEMVPVFRSADSSAEDDASAVREWLSQAGLHPVLLTDREPDVLPGCTEVRVPASEEAEAQTILAAARNAEPEPGDASHHLDLVTVFEAVGTEAEVEAISIRALLDSLEIPSVLIGTSAIPILPFLVKVPQSRVDQARMAIDEARNAGSTAAEEAEQATEPGD